FAHLPAAFWYVAGLTAVQLSLVRSWQHDEIAVRADSLEEASHYQGVLVVPGAIAGIATGIALWAQLDYDLIATPWLVVLEVLYVVTLLVCLPHIGIGLRRARIAALQARKPGRPTPHHAAVMAD